MKYELIVKYKYTITITTKPNIIEAEECDWGGGGHMPPLRMPLDICTFSLSQLIYYKQLSLTQQEP